MCFCSTKRRSLQRVGPPYPFVSPLWSGKEAPAHCDVVIVGATISSLYLSILLRKHGISVLIIEEREFLGDAHFLRGLGMGNIGLVDNAWRLSSAIGFEESQKILQYSQQSLSLYKKLCPPQQGGGFHFAKGERELEELHHSHQLLCKMGISSTFLEKRNIPAELQQSYMGGLFLKEECIADPEGLLKKLIIQAQEWGVHISFSSKIHTIDDQEESIIVEHRKTTHCDVLVFAHSSNLAQLDPFFLETQKSIRSQAIALPLHEAPSPYSFSSQYGYFYWRDWQDLRIFGGCRWASPHLETGERDENIIHPNIEKALRKSATTLFPSIEDRVLYRWSRIEFHSCDALPLVGPLPGRGDRLSMTSLMGRDIGLGFACAQSIATLITEGKSNLLPNSFLPRRLL